MQAGNAVSFFGYGLILPFEIIYLHQIRGFATATAGCPLGSLSSELAETDEPARTALAASFDRWEAPIRNGLRRMRDRGGLRDDTDVDRLALGTLAALQGGLLLTQAKRDAGPLEAALDLAIGQISCHLT